MSSMTDGSLIPKVLAATETPGESGMKWFQGTADAVRHFLWLFEVGEHLIASSYLFRLNFIQFRTSIVLGV